MCVSQGCYNRSPQTWGLITQIGGPKFKTSFMGISRCGQAGSSVGPGGETAFFVSWKPEICGPFLRSLQIIASVLTSSSSVVNIALFPATKELAIAFWARPDNPGKSPHPQTPNLIAPAKSLCHERCHSQVLGVGTWMSLGSIIQATGRNSPMSAEVDFLLLAFSTQMKDWNSSTQKTDGGDLGY